MFAVEINGFISYIYGNKFKQRASERSAKKFKARGTIDLWWHKGSHVVCLPLDCKRKWQWCSKCIMVSDMMAEKTSQIKKQLIWKNVHNYKCATTTVWILMLLWFMTCATYSFIHFCVCLLHHNLFFPYRGSTHLSLLRTGRFDIILTAYCSSCIHLTKYWLGVCIHLSATNLLSKDVSSGNTAM